MTCDEPLSHLRYVQVQIFILVPSIFEPFGLTQLVAMRYGSISVVRKTGGSDDLYYLIIIVNYSSTAKLN